MRNAVAARLPARFIADTLVSLPAIARIRAQYPAPRLTLLTESEVAGSGRVSPWIILEETGRVSFRTSCCWRSVVLGSARCATSSALHGDRARTTLPDA